MTGVLRFLVATVGGACAQQVLRGCTVGSVSCFVDDSKRILEPALVNQNGEPLTPEWCSQLCRERGKPLAGVEYGVQCYCGTRVREDAVAAPVTDCNKDCSGSSKSKCGGEWRIGVFNVSCSGPPEPRPKLPKRLVNPCLDEMLPYKSMPWCNSTLPLENRVEDMLSRMSITEKIGQLDTAAPAVASLGLNKYDWWSEATHGISHVQNQEPTRYESNFAFPITTGMSFNRSLWHETAAQIAREARAFMNVGNAYSTFWAPVINLAREPRWGRNIETPGEDPYLTGEYAVAFVKGFENAPDDPGHIQASACCKHYVANSMEASTVAGTTWTRHNFSANLSMRDLVDTYMLPFQACVEKGRVSGLMCSYNAVNGVPSCANDWLLTTVARKSWGFDGYITSDCDADADVFNEHHFESTPEEVVRDVLRAGTDVDCTSFVGNYGKSALDKGLITEEDIDDRLRKLLKVRMRLSHFDPVGPLDMIPPSVVCSDYAQALARDGSAQSATLLKNEGGLLPLDASKLTKVAVIGPNSKLSQATAGYYGGVPCNNKYWNMVDAVQQYVPDTETAEGVSSVLSDDVSGVPAAAAMAARADAVVLVIGTDLSVAREGSDAKSITLSQGQESLITAVAEAAKRPVVVVILSAVPLDISNLLAQPKVGAVLHVGQPAVQTLGIGDVLFGRKVPAGRMIQTVYPKSYADQISIFDFNMRPGQSNWPRPDCPESMWASGKCELGTNPGRTYRFFTGKPVVPFGFGLSYTTFKYEVVSGPASLGLGRLHRELEIANAKGQHINAAVLEAAGPAPTYILRVSNTGNIDADDVVLGFLVPPGAGQDGVPLQMLFGFERVHVPAGQSVMVTLYPGLGEFSRTDDAGRRHALTGEYRVRFGVETAHEEGGMGYTESALTAHAGEDDNELEVVI